MNKRIIVTVLSLSSALMPLAAHADPRCETAPAPVSYAQPAYAQPVYVQPAYAQPVYAPTVYVRPAVQPAYAQPVVAWRGHDADDRRVERDGRGERDMRDVRGGFNGRNAQYGQSTHGRWQGQFGGR